MKKILFFLSLFISAASFGQNIHSKTQPSGTNNTTISTTGFTTGQVNDSISILPSKFASRTARIPFGTMITPTMFYNGVTANGATMGKSGGTVTMSGGTNDYLKYLVTNYISMLESFTITSYVKITSTVSSTSYGFGFGRHAYWVWMDCSTGANRGKLFVDFHGSGVDTNFATSSTAVTFSQNDVFKATWSKIVDTITFTVYDTTTHATATSVSYVYPKSAYAITSTGLPILAGQYNVLEKGGTYDITGFTLSTPLPHNPSIVVLGDSKAQGVGGSNAHDSTYAFLLDSLFGPCVNMGSSGDNTADILNRIGEVLTLNPHQVILEVGSNDIRQSVATATWQSNYNRIVDTLTKAGIEVYHTVFFEDSPSVSITPLNTFVKTTYPNTYIDTWDSLANCIACAPVRQLHPTGIGHDTIYQAILHSGLLQKGTSPIKIGFIDASNTGWTSNSTAQLAVIDSGAFKKSYGDAVGLLQKSGNPSSSGIIVGTLTNQNVDFYRNNYKTMSLGDYPYYFKYYSKSGAQQGTLLIDSLGTTILGNQIGGAYAGGNYDVFIGNLAGNSTIDGGYNTFVGALSGKFNVHGGNNVAIGEAAGYYNVGSFNTYLGPQTNFGNTGSVSISNSVFIGYQAGYNETTSNKLCISNVSTKSSIYGDFSTNKFNIGGTTAAPTLDSTLRTEGSLHIAKYALVDSALKIREGTNGTAGQTTLVSGTKALTINGISSNSRAFITLVSQGGTTTTTVAYEAVCTNGTLTINAVTSAGTNTVNTGDTSVLNYFVIN